MLKIPVAQRIYLDESGVNEYLYRQYGRGFRNQKILGEVSGKRFARQSVISALFKGKFLSPMCFEGTCDTILFNIWLKKVLIPKLSPGQVLILDIDAANVARTAEAGDIMPFGVASGATTGGWSAGSAADLTDIAGRLNGMVGRAFTSAAARTGTGAGDYNIVKVRMRGI